MTPYSVNWTRDKTHGNSIQSGATLLVKVEGADHATIAVYQEGILVNVDFDDNKDGKVECQIKLIQRSVISGQVIYSGFPKGKYHLKTRAWINSRGKGWDDEFQVI